MNRSNFLTIAAGALALPMLPARVAAAPVVETLDTFFAANMATAGVAATTLLAETHAAGHTDVAWDYQQCSAPGCSHKRPIWLRDHERNIQEDLDNFDYHWEASMIPEYKKSFGLGYDVPGLHIDETNLCFSFTGIVVYGQDDQYVCPEHWAHIAFLFVPSIPKHRMADCVAKCYNSHECAGCDVYRTNHHQYQGKHYCNLCFYRLAKSLDVQDDPILTAYYDRVIAFISAQYPQPS
jgi:hypothetical protein